MSVTIKTRRVRSVPLGNGGVPTTFWDARFDPPCGPVGMGRTQGEAIGNLLMQVLAQHHAEVEIVCEGFIDQTKPKVAS